MNNFKKFYNKEYSKQIKLDENINTNKKIYFIKEILISNPKRLKILDVGCGSGGVLNEFKKNNFVFGIDISDIALKSLEKKGIKGLNIDIQEDYIYKQIKHKFDVIICFDVLEHLFYPEKALKNLNKCLNKNGILIVNVPNEFVLPKRIKTFFLKEHIFYFEGFEEWNYPHIRFFTNKKFKNLLHITGFRKIKDYSYLTSFNKIKIPFGKSLTKLFSDEFANSHLFSCLKK
jgi:2-polyprenyl-3-methyl-5-hydroxy-6-metoxy-1,4-benzoquinol methylase